MPFFATENLTTQSLKQCPNPWEFTLTQEISAQVRGCKEDRQAWYQSPGTRHQFYTGIEPYNNAARVSKENPPLYIHAFAVDYDLPIPDERLKECIKALDIQPAWIETSLGGNRRLVWLLSKPLLVGSADFCSFLLLKAVDWLHLQMLPGLDEPAFLTATRLYCNGGVWEKVGNGSPIPPAKAQAFLVQCGKEYRFKAPADDQNIPLGIVFKALQDKFPALDWPGEFALETQGPSFWIPDSLSPQSAIVKAGGMFTFSGHATSPFYSWSDILGPEFVREFAQNSIAKATEDIWWDSHNFWRKKGGAYLPVRESELMNYFVVECKLGKKAGSDGVTPIELALNHIYNQQWVTGAAPFVFKPAGLLIFNGERRLNTYCKAAMKPVAEKQEWGPAGKFPFLSAYLDSLFDPPEQLPHFLAWWWWYYKAALYQDPQPGQNTFFLGGAGIGKTLLNRFLVGASVGGFVDAADFLTEGQSFNSHLLKHAHWCLDDDSPAGSPAAMARTAAMFKKLAANQQFQNNEKFEKGSMCEWAGRIGCTANLDFVSTRIIGPMDNSSLDKTNIFRCAKKILFQFPSRNETRATIDRELPCLLRWLDDWTPPEFLTRNPRYGFDSYHEQTLLDQTHQSSPIAPFKEVLLTTLSDYFMEHQDATQWTGTLTQLVRLIMTNPQNEFIMRSVRLEQTNRYLEYVQKEGLIQCVVDTGDFKMRVWTFSKPGLLTAVVPPAVLINTVNTPFEKP